MRKQTRTNHPIYSLLPVEVKGFDSLSELALDMRPRDRIERVAAGPVFRQGVDDLTLSS